MGLTISAYLDELKKYYNYDIVKEEKIYKSITNEDKLKMANIHEARYKNAYSLPCSSSFPHSPSFSHSSSSKDVIHSHYPIRSKPKDIYKREKTNKEHDQILRDWLN